MSQKNVEVVRRHQEAFNRGRRWRCVSPLAHQPRGPIERRFILRGKPLIGDGVVRLSSGRREVVSVRREAEPLDCGAKKRRPSEPPRRNASGTFVSVMQTKESPNERA